MLFDDYALDYGVAFTPVDLHGMDAGHGAASGSAIAATANDDWLLGTGLHPLDFSVFTPPAPLGSPGTDAGSGIAGIAAAATAADHDRMLAINPYEIDPNFPPVPSRPLPQPPAKPETYVPWYYPGLTPLTTPGRPT